MRPLWIAAAGALAAVTCDDAKPAVSLADDIAAEFCAQEFACCSPFEISLITSDRYTTEEGCVAFSTIDARTQLGAVEGAIAQGRITVDETRLAACAMAYAGRHCGTSAQAPSTFSPLPSVADFIAACPGLLVGHVADGQACNLAAECQAGARCATGAPASGAGGIAGVPTGVGGTSGAIANAPGVCLRYQQRDQPCNSSSDCDPAADLACRKPDFRCSDPLQEGEPCTVQNDPFTGLLSDDCDARKGLFCDFPGSFVCRHIPRADEPCSQFRLPQCDPDPALGLSCNAFSNTCKSPGHDGDACGAPAIPPCRDDLACRPTQPDGIGTCDSLPALGDPCIDRCASPAICVNRVCTAPGSARLGAACETNNDCASLYCAAFNGATKLCAAPPIASPICVGAGVTPAGGGAGGTFGTGVGGFGGTFTTGTAGSVAVGTSGRTGRGGTVGTAGAGGSAGAGGASGSAGAGGGVSLGCPLSEPAMGDPLIADFSVDGATTFPIGGTFTFSTMQPLGPAATVAGGALHITADVPGVMNAQFLGAGIFFFGNPPGLGCIDAAFHTGVQFDVSGTIDGAGCTAHFAVNDSAHTDNTLDAKGAGPMGVYAPQAPFDVTATPTTIMIPFAGPGAPTDGNPAIPLDPSKLTGVQWQFTVGADPGDSCAVEIAIDNVRFF